MSFSLNFKWPEAIAASFKVLDQFVEVFNMEISSNGILIETIDFAQTCLLQLKFRPDAFRSLQIDSPISLGVHTNSLMKVVKHIKEGDDVSMSSFGDDKFKLVINRNGVRSEYILGQMLIVGESMTIPELQYDCEVLLSCKVVDYIHRELKSIGDVIQIEMTPNYLSFRCQGTTIGVHLQINSDSDCEGFALNCDESHLLSFKYTFIEKLFKSVKLSEADSILLQMGKDRPLSLVCKISGGILNIFVAPMIED